MYQSLLKKVDTMTKQLERTSSGLLSIPKMIKCYQKTLPEEQNFFTTDKKSRRSNSKNYF